MAHALICAHLAPRDAGHSPANIFITNASCTTEWLIKCDRPAVCTGLAAAVARLEVQLNKLKLDKWAHSALLQLGRTNLLVGLAGSSRSGASSSSGSSHRRATVT